MTMLRSPLVCAGLSLAVLIGAYVACGGEDDVPDQTGKQPPPPPEGAPNADGTGKAWAVSRLFLGGTDRNGSNNTSAWKDYGYNLDKRISTKESTDVCKPAAGGPSSVHDDGNAGVDNSFGKTLWPIIQGLASDAEVQINESIHDGAFSIIVNMENLGSGANYLNITSKLYAGTGIVNDEVPVWDGTDEWLVARELLSNPNDILSSTVVFPFSYLNNNTWVSGTEGRLDLSVNVQGFELKLAIEKAVITMDLDGGHTHATGGIIAGILPAESLIGELKKVAGSFDKSLCTGATFDSLADQLRQASDIMADGNQDPNQTCNGISVGLGFDAEPVLLGGIDVAAPPSGDPCKCGDGTLDTGEECDDSNNANDDGCDEDCQLEGAGGGGGTGGAGGNGGAGGSAGGSGGAGGN